MKKVMMIMLAVFLPSAAWSGIAAKTKKVIIPSNGVYIYDLNGDFCTSESWNAENNNDVVGIALITDKTKALIALKNANTDGYVVWGPDGLVDGVVTTASNYSNCIPGAAESDFSGASNTQKEMEQLLPGNNTALYLANAYMFPDNHNGYLPALGELIDMFENIEVVNNLLELVGGEEIEDFWYWSSTQHYLNYRAWAYGGTDSEGNRWFAQLRNENSPLANYYGACRINVRPFGVISQSFEVEDGELEKPADFVDLGLSVNWATWNLGANAPEEIGGYFAWGETNPKTHFDKNNYQYYENGNYQDIGNDISGTIYDAARANWGEGWRMPTKAELNEMASKCTHSEYTLNGVPGLLFESSNGNSIFLPKTGHDYEEGVGPSESNGCGLWSSTSCGSSFAYRAWEWSYISFSYRHQGFPIRPVREKNNEAIKCSIPTISYVNGKLTFSSETEGAEFVSEITDVDIKKNYTNEVNLTVTYYINVYATKAGYNNSDVATATLCWIDVTPEGENVVVGKAEVRANPVLIQSNGGMLSIRGVAEGTAISVYDTAGCMVGSATATNGTTNISTALGSGTIGIVKIGDKSVKVVM